MYTYVKGHEGEIASEVLPGDRVGAICFDAREVSAIGWALLAKCGELKSGTIEVDRRSLLNANDPTSLETALYKNAARRLNRNVGNALVDRRNFTGEPPESRFSRRAGISPCWRWSGREAFALIELLSIRLQPGLGLKAYLPFRNEPDPEIRVKRYLEEYQLLRAFTDRCREVRQLLA